MYEEDSDTRWCKELGEEVEVRGCLGNVEVCEYHIDGSSADRNIL